MTAQAPSYCLLGLPFHAVAVADAVACIRHAIVMRVPLLLTTPNVNFVIACGKDAAFRNAVIDRDLLVAGLNGISLPVSLESRWADVFSHHNFIRPVFEGMYPIPYLDQSNLSPASCWG